MQNPDFQVSYNPGLRIPYLVPALFTPAECRQIRESVGQAPVVGDPYAAQHPEAVIGPTGLRRQLNQPEVAGWVLKRIMQAAYGINQSHFRFVIEGMEVPHVIEYQPGHQSFWHMDITDDQTTNRKLTMLVFLSDASEFTGGRFVAYPESLTFDQSQGNLLLFPAFLLHKVEPILTGTRFTLATWGIGPPFR